MPVHEDFAAHGFADIPKDLRVSLPDLVPLKALLDACNNHLRAHFPSGFPLRSYQRFDVTAVTMDEHLAFREKTGPKLLSDRHTSFPIYTGQSPAETQQRVIDSFERSILHSFDE